MTDCLVSADRLAAYADGSLAVADRPGVESHLESCARCRSELEWLQSLARETAALPRSMTPPVELWSGVSGRLEPRRGRRLIQVRPFALAAAAAGLIVATSVATALWLRGHAQPSSLATNPPGVVLPAGAHDQSLALAALVQQVRALEATLPSATRSLVQDQLLQIDAAIQESEAALSGSGNRPAVQLMLEARYQQRLELLQQAQRVARRI